jgi:L-asparaginase
MDLRILAIGGTFDKRYDPITGALGFGETHLHEIVARARVAGPVQVDVVMMIDSLDMVDEHRQRVLAACRDAPEAALVVVHGTDTMVDTARVIAGAGLPKTIVLTGAMVPYAVADTDASFNLGAAIAFARSLAPGVWVAMNGVAHTWSNVRKNRERGVFEPLA